MKSWKEKRNYLFELIKKISDNSLGDDSAFLKEYCLFVLHRYRSSLDEAIMCFESQLIPEVDSFENNFEIPDIRKINDVRNYSLYKPWMLQKSE